MPLSGRLDQLEHSILDRIGHPPPPAPPPGLGTAATRRPTVVVPPRPGRERSEGALGPSSVARSGSSRQGRRGHSEGGAHDDSRPVRSMPSEDESGAAADRIGLARLRQVSAAASSTSHLSLSRTDTRLSTATAETSDAASFAAPVEPSAARAISIRPRLDRRRSSTGAVTAMSNAEDGRLLLVSTSLPARPRKQSSFASSTAAPFSNLVVLPDAALSSTVEGELRPAQALRPLRSVSTTVVHAGPPNVLKRKASVTTRGRYRGESSGPAVSTSRSPRRPSTAGAAVESGPSSPFGPPIPPPSSSYPSHSASAWLPPSPAPVFATAPLDLVSTASSSTEALPRTSSCQRHSRGRSQGRARSKSKPKPRAESTSTSAASASETDSAAGSATATAGWSAGASKTGTIRSGLLKLRKSTASLRNAFRPSRLDIPPLPPALPAAPTSSSPSAAPPGPALPLSPIRTAPTPVSLISSVAGAAVDHAALEHAHEPEPFSPTTPRASRRLGAPSSRPTRTSENAPPVPALPVAAQQEVRRARARSGQRRPATATVVPPEAGVQLEEAPPGSASVGRGKLRRAMSTSVLRSRAGDGGPAPRRPEPPRGGRVEEWARESGR